MSLDDINDLPDSPNAGQSGHRQSHAKIHSGLKSVKAELDSLDSKFATTSGVSEARLGVQVIPVAASPASHQVILDSSSAISATGRIYRYASGAWELTGTRVPFTDANGAVYSRQTAITTNYETIQWGAKFGVVIGDNTNPVVEMGFAMLSGITVARIHAKVNGEWLTKDPEEFTVTSSPHVYQITLPLGAHTVEIYHTRARINYLRLPNLCSVFPVAQSAYRIACYGASFVANDYSWVNKIRKLSGAETFQCGVAGSGYLSAPVTTGDTTMYYINSARLDALEATDPDVVVLENSGNDNGSSYSSLVTAKLAWLDEFESRMPGKRIIILDAPPRGYTDSMTNNMAANLASTRAAINARPNMNIIGYHDFVGTLSDMIAYTSGANYAVGDRKIYIGAIWECKTAITTAPATLNTRDWKMFGWYTGTGRIGSPTGNGTRDVLMGSGSDDTHPDPIGYDTMGQAYWSAIQSDIARDQRVATLTHSTL